jgi:hypothetical protein
VLLIFLTLGWQLAAWGQTCAEKKKECNASCEAAVNTIHPLHPPAFVKSCEQDCYCREGCATCITPPPPSPRPWDLVPSKDGLDPNGFLRNPNWAWPRGPGGELRDVCDNCSCRLGTWGFDAPDQVQDWLGSATCTHGPIHENSNNLCSGGPAQTFGHNASGVGYHMNWEPVEYEGPLQWEDHSEWLFPGTSGDNEYTFNILRPDLALVAKRREGKGVHLEFNSTETVDEWDNSGTWWEHFHKDVVDQLDNGAIGNALGTPFAVVLGMLGLDVAHTDHHAELHPVYAMFIRDRPAGLLSNPLTSDLPASEVRWAFFVKNWGSEGACGHDDEQLGIEHIDVQLPDRELIGSKSIVIPYRHGQDHEACAHQVESDTNGVIRFHLSTPDMKCGYFGELTMRNSPLTVSTTISTGSAAPALASRQAAFAEEQESFAEEQEADPLNTKIAKLNPSERQQLNKQLSDLMREPRRQPAFGEAIEVKQLGSPFPRADRFKVTAKNVKAVPDPASQAKKAKKHQLIDEFLKARGIQ